MPESKFQETPRLANFGNVVPEGYAYYQKMIVPREGFQAPGGYLKWYDIHPLDHEITDEQRTSTRAFITEEARTGRLALKEELGFVILHRAGPMLLLMVMSWRNTNEIWESVYHREVEGQTGYRVQEFETGHRGTFCVWELGAVWHERNAWVRFIQSKRDDQAKLAYLKDQFSGQV